MNRKIIAFCYKARSGKDAACQYLNKNYGFKQIAFADPLKAACREVFGFTSEQLYGNLKEVVDPYWNTTPRKVLQTVGTELFRDRFDPDIWIKATFKKILSNPNYFDWAISDCRFINEALAVKANGGILVKLTRQGSQINGVQNHRSENHLDSFHDWDYVIDNNGSLDDFYRKLDNLMEILGVTKR